MHMQTEKPNAIILVSIICVFKKAVLMSALPTHCELISRYHIVIGEGTFGRVKAGHLDSLDLQCAVKEGKVKLYFHPVFEARVLQEPQGCKFFHLCAEFVIMS